MERIVRVVHGAFVVAQEEKDTGPDLVVQAAAALNIRLGWKHEFSPLFVFYGNSGFSGPGIPLSEKEYYTSKPPVMASGELDRAASPSDTCRLQPSLFQDRKKGDRSRQNLGRTDIWAD
jgi:hypothetical protein